MALQCTPENIQQMMMALKASFGQVDNERKQVCQAHAYPPSVTISFYCRPLHSFSSSNSSPDFRSFFWPSSLRRAASLRPFAFFKQLTSRARRPVRRHPTSPAPQPSASKTCARSTGRMMTASTLSFVKRTSSSSKPACSQARALQPHAACHPFVTLAIARHVRLLASSLRVVV